MSRNKHRSTTRQRPAAIVRPVATEEKANPAFASVTMLYDVPQPHTMPRNYQNYANQGYAANDSVYKCVQYILTNGAAIPPKLYTDATKQTEIKSHPLLDRMARPNADQDGVTFREGVLGWYLITGNAFIYAIRKHNAPPDELWALETNKVHPLPTPQGIKGYRFDDFGDDKLIAREDMGHLRTWNPKDPIFGLSPIEVAALMIDQQNAARKWNLALLQNYAKPSGAWVTETPLAKNERDRLEERINEKLAAARNAGRVPVLDAGAKWVPSSLPPSELDWLESLRHNAGQIANIYNIPPQLIGDTSASTYNNMEQAKAASYTEAIFPTLDKLYSLLSMWLVKMYPDLCDAQGNPQACLYYDKNSVEVVQNVIQEREQGMAQRAGQLYMQGAITLNQAHEMMNLPTLGASGEVYRFGAVLVPADRLLAYAEQSMTTPAAPPEPHPEPIVPSVPPPAPTTKPDEPAKPAGEPAPPAPAPAPAPGKPAEQPPAQPPADGKKGLAYPFVLDASGDAHGKAFPTGDPRGHSFRLAQRRVQARLREEHTTLVAYLHEADAHGMTPAEALQQMLARIPEQTALWLALLTALTTTIAQTSGTRTARALAAKVPAGTHVPATYDAEDDDGEVRDLCDDDLPAQAQSITTTTHDRLRDALGALVLAGTVVSVAGLISALAQHYSRAEADDGWSSVIAEHTTVQAWEAGAHDAASACASALTSSGSTSQVIGTWNTMGDNRVRPDHVDADGQQQPWGESFLVGGDLLRYPGDPQGSLSQTMGCRCWVEYDVSDGSGSSGSGDDTTSEKTRRRLNAAVFRAFREVTLG